MIKVTILEGNIDEKLWPKLILAMTYVKNNKLTRALQNPSPYKVYSQEPPNLTYLQILGSTIYVLLPEKEQLIKSEKWASRILKRVLLGYDGHTIYWVYIKNQNKIIRVKDLCILEDYKTKMSIELPNYNDDRPTFYSFFSKDNDEKRSEKLLSTYIESQKIGNTERKQLIFNTCIGQKVSNIEPVSTIAYASQKAQDVKAIFTTRIGQKVQDAKGIPTTIHTD